MPLSWLLVYQILRQSDNGFENKKTKKLSKFLKIHILEMLDAI